MRSAARLSGLLLVPTLAAAQAGNVAATLHNLSSSGPGELRAEGEREICKFCHVPHSAEAQTPLWGHAPATTRRYEVPDLASGPAGRASAPQPEGGSRLCLSCHDGSVALGDLGRRGRIAMAGAQRLAPGRPAHLGTDLSGSHPVSVALPESPEGGRGEASDMVLRPLALVRAEGRVHLDAQGRMQCRTCHDPHDDRFFEPGRVPHFWVAASVSEVCLACHELR